ncbi:MAG: iron chelate uptake ABC transporter family permease subunit [Propionibacterium sp.]|nr:iron chelate uptake ABC transporter family permease subunit [Propionibacterium sp.]
MRTAVVSTGLILLLAALSLVTLMTGKIALSPAEVLATLTGRTDDARAIQVVSSIRVPRALTGIAVGMALGGAGCVFQSVSRNALGSPDVIGFTTGAATGAVVQIVVFDAGPAATSLAAVATGLLTAVLVYTLSRSNGTTGGYRLVLVGIGVSAFLAALNTLVLARGDLDLATRARIWLSGSLNARTWADTWPVVVAVVVLLPLLCAQARRLDALEMGDDQALQLGVHAERTRVVTMLAAVVLTAAAVGAAGPIAFVALAAPQLASRLTRVPRVQVLTSALTGAALLVAADVVSVHLPLRAALPVGLATGALGGCYLLWLLTRTRQV